MTQQPLEQPQANRPQPPQRHLILGGQKSGKSRHAEGLAAQWLAISPQHSAVMLATACAHDDEMRQRIARHRRERRLRVPAMRTVDAPHALPAAILQAGGAHTLRVVDCLTVWLTQQLMPLQGAPAVNPAAALLEAVAQCPGPIVLVGSEIGLGVIPLGREVRAFVDALGALNQQLASACDRVTLMVAGLPLAVKGGG